MQLAHQPFVIAIIGGIASGKSTIAKAFAAIGAQIIETDVLAKSLYEPDTELYQKLRQRFGMKILTPTLEIDRAVLKKIILDSPTEKVWLESEIHPKVQHLVHQAIRLSHAPLCVIEIPLLKDKKDYPEIHYILMTRCSKEEQVRRLMRRNILSEQEAQVLIAAGIPESLQEKLANEVIDTTHLRDQDLMDWVTHFVSEHLKD